MAHGGARPGAGKKKGTKASHTLQAEVARKKLIEMYSVAAEQINLVLIDKALKGDMLAIKELHDRAFGKAYQPGEMDVTSGGKPFELSDDQYKQALAAAIKRGNSDQGSA